MTKGDVIDNVRAPDKRAQLDPDSKLGGRVPPGMLERGGEDDDDE